MRIHPLWSLSSVTLLFDYSLLVKRVLEFKNVPAVLVAASAAFFFNDVSSGIQGPPNYLLYKKEITKKYVDVEVTTRHPYPHEKRIYLAVKLSVMACGEISRHNM